MSPERALLLACARVHLGTGDVDEVRRMLPSIDPGCLRAQAFHDGLAGLASRPLRELGNTALEDLARETFAAGARLQTLAHRAGEALHRAGQEAVLLKGAALLETAYAGRLHLRPLSDVDLLVRDAAAAVRALEPLGLGKATTGLARGTLALDLHEDLLSAEGTRRLRSPYLFSSEDLWASSRPLRPGLRLLGPEHQALHLATHLLKHAHARPIWLVDLALALPEASPEALLRLAATTRSTRALAYGVHLLETTLRVRSHLQGLPRLGVVEAAYLHRATRTAPTEYEGKALAALACPSWRDRAAYLWQYCMPPLDVLRRRHPTTPTWLLPARRLATFAGLGLHVLRGVKSRPQRHDKWRPWGS